MAGFEVIVRPVIFPDIRPRAKQSLPPQDDPEKGFAVIKGNPAQSVDLTYGWGASSSKTSPVEIERRVDKARSYQQEEDGTINRKNFVEFDVANRITTNEQLGLKPAEYKVEYYQPIQEDLNIEIKRKNVIMRDGKEWSG